MCDNEAKVFRSLFVPHGTMQAKWIDIRLGLDEVCGMKTKNGKCAVPVLDFVVAANALQT
jgi:hypothetical protein